MDTIHSVIKWSHSHSRENKKRTRPPSTNSDCDWVKPQERPCICMVRKKWGLFQPPPSSTWLRCYEIRSHIGFTRESGVVFKFERLSHLLDRFFGLGSSIVFKYSSLMYSLRADREDLELKLSKVSSFVHECSVFLRVVNSMISHRLHMRIWSDT